MGSGRRAEEGLAMVGRGRPGRASRAVGAKPLREYNEVKGYASAARWVYSQALNRTNGMMDVYSASTKYAEFTTWP